MPGRRLITLLTLVALFQACTLTTADSPVVLITGADNGTGYALVKEYAEQGWRVIATCREPDTATALQSLVKQYANLALEPLDVRDLRQIDALADAYRGIAIDVLINNEELRADDAPGELGALDFEAFDSYTAVNVTAPLKITESFVEHVAASEHRKIMTITSIDSSLSNVSQAGDYFYRASKAAVNIIMVTMAPDLSQRGITIGLVAPLEQRSGQGGRGPQAHDIFATIEKFSVATSATLKRSDGQELAW